MSADTIALPSHLVDTLYRGVTLYRGTWSTETRQGAVYMELGCVTDPI